MIRRRIDENAISLKPEDSDDLLALRRIIRAGDRVAADTSRTIKREKEYARPDKGRRVRVSVALQVDRASLDASLGRLRVGGTILESNNESVPHGSHHSIVIKAGDALTLSKRRWSATEKKLSRSAGGRAGFVLVAIDTSECGIARLRGTHLEMLPNIYSGAGGKRYRTDFDIAGFFGRARSALDSACAKTDTVMVLGFSHEDLKYPKRRKARAKTDTVVVFGPGETKNKFANFLQKAGYRPLLAEGIDSGGEDGIYTFTRSQAMREVMSESKLARVSAIIDEIMALAGKRSRKFTTGLAETQRAERLGAVRMLVFSDRAVEEHGEEEVVRLLNGAEEGGAETFCVDSTTDLGMRVAGLGGIVSLLRYAVDVDSASQSR